MCFRIGFGVYLVVHSSCSMFHVRSDREVFWLCTLHFISEIFWLGEKEKYWGRIVSFNVKVLEMRINGLMFGEMK